MAAFDRLVVALKSPDGDESLVRYASMLARLGRARELRFVHVVDGEAPTAELRETLRARLEPAARQLDARVGCDVLRGALTDRLLEYVTDFQADLIVIGSRKHKLGARLAMVAPCSVAVVPDGHAATLSHLMVSVDFSDDAGWVLQWSTELASAAPAIRVTALHVITHESTDLFAAGEGDEAQTGTMRRLIATSDHHGVVVQPRVSAVTRAPDSGWLPSSTQSADVAFTILSEARACGADCVALSTRGRSRSASILLGSVAEKVIERATVPLLVGKHGHRKVGLAAILLGTATVGGGLKTN